MITARAVLIKRNGGPEVLDVQPWAVPSPGPGQIAIDVRAAGVNFADILIRLGLYPDRPKPPCVVGYEVAGVVAEVGEGVESFERGARVIAATRFGGYADRVVADVRNVLALPDSFSFEEGAAIPLNYGTAWAALNRYGGLQEGERVLIHSAGGGVGIAAIQLARHAGAAVYGAASADKHDALRRLGVDCAIDYRRSEWTRGLGGFDLVLDPIGGRSLRRSFGLLRPGGRLVTFGASGIVSGDHRRVATILRGLLGFPRFSSRRLMIESKSVIGLNLLPVWDSAGSIERWIRPLAKLLSAGVIRPVVFGAYEFDRAGEAHAALSSRSNVGKAVLVP